MYPADTPRIVVQRKHREEIEGDDIEDLNCLIRTSCREASAVLTDGHRSNLSLVGLELFDKFDSLGDFLPELDDAINGTRNDEVGQGGYGDEGQLLLVHKGFGIA